MATVTNKLTNVFVGDYGIVITITFKDEDGTLQDVSSFTTKKVFSRSPDGRKIVTSTAGFTSDGTDGKITYSYANGDIDRDGVWKAQAELNNGTAVVYSHVFDVVVEERISKT